MRTGIIDVAGTIIEKDTKTHATRSISIDAGTVTLLRSYQQKVLDRATLCGMELAPGAFVLSEWPDGSKPYRLDKATMTFRSLRGKIGLGDERPSAPAPSRRHLLLLRLLRWCGVRQRRSIENSSTCVRRMLLPDGSRNDVSMP